MTEAQKLDSDVAAAINGVSDVDVTTESAGQEPQEEAKVNEAGGTSSQSDESNEKADEADKKDEDDDTNDDPAWLRKELTKARNEAAARRVSEKALQDQLKKAKTPEEVAAVVEDYTKQVAEKNKELLRLSVAYETQLPKDLAGRLVGDTKEELEADAKLLLRFTGQQEEDTSPGGGLNPTDRGDGLSSDPAELRKILPRR